MTDRKGDWIQTYTGKKFWPLDPRPEDVCFEDIAHALSNLCRFGGQCEQFYSVAQHSIMVAREAPKRIRPLALLHDAAEAYLVDVPRPIKRHLVGYEDAERLVEQAIGDFFGLDVSRDRGQIKLLDQRALVTEQRALMPEGWRQPGPQPEPFTWLSNPLPPAEAEEEFWAMGLWTGVADADDYAVHHFGRYPLSDERSS